jgi:hypothetical protein
MAKKVDVKFTVSIVKNTEKGGAWLGRAQIARPDQDVLVMDDIDAFSNASAAKRWAKTLVATYTPRKSVKFVEGTERDEKDKPVSFTGELIYKADAFK